MESANSRPDDMSTRAHQLRVKMELVELASWSRTGPHARRAGRWASAALWTAWAAAFAAAISTLTVVADHTAWAAALTIAAAGLSTFIAAVKPAERAGAHNSSRVGFEAVQDAMRDSNYDLPRTGPTATDLRVAQKLYDSAYARFTELKKTSPAVDPDHFPG